MDIVSEKGQIVIKLHHLKKSIQQQLTEGKLNPYDISIDDIPILFRNNITTIIKENKHPVIFSYKNKNHLIIYNK